MSLNIPRRLSAVVAFLLLAAAAHAQPSLLPQTGSSTNITPVVTVSPSSLPANRSVEIYLIVSNGNATSTKQIQSGDAFTITMDGGLSNAYGFPLSPLVNSATLVPGDFSVAGAHGLQIVITYTNATPKVFAPGDTLSLRVSFTTPAAPGVFKLGWQGPYVKGASNGRFNEVVPRFTAVQVAAATASAVTSVTASGPLQSSGGTTPNVSLTGVVPVANGGTGISTLGGAGNYLRSDGTTWTHSNIQASDLPAGSGNYIQNGTTAQANANFNISGNGMAGGTLSGNIIKATRQFNLGDNRVLSQPGSNLFVGTGTGSLNAGDDNSFFGISAGAENRGGMYNSFFGFEAGHANRTGSFNTFFGHSAGFSNDAGNNAFFGRAAGYSNYLGYNNAFFGIDAGRANTTGSHNTIIGASANVGANNLNNATALGSVARVDCSNCLVLGSIANINGASVSTNVGIGTPSPTARLHVAGGDLLFENKWRTETTAYTPNLMGGFLGTGSSGPTPGNRVTAGVVGAMIGGGGFNGTINGPSGTILTGDNSNRVTDWFGTVGGGIKNRAGNDDATPDNARFATVGGGDANTASNLASTVGGGSGNSASGTYSTVGGGSGNSANNSFSTVGGGDGNTAFGFTSTVGGGNGNTASNNYSTVGGGNSNTASGERGTVGGGSSNTAGGFNSVVPGGEANSATGNYSFAAGRRAKAFHQGAFVWADSTDADFSSTANDQFIIRAAGGVGIGTTAPSYKLHVNGNIHATGSITSSDQRYKQNIRTLNDALARIRRLRGVSYEWNRAAYPEMQFASGTQLGFIAQEVEPVLPEIVHKSSTGMYSLNYPALVPVLVEAVKEQQQQVEKVQAENEALKLANAALKERLNRLEQAVQKLTEAAEAQAENKPKNVER
jgi:hypothetical protein